MIRREPELKPRSSVLASAAAMGALALLAFATIPQPATGTGTANRAAIPKAATLPPRTTRATWTATQVASPDSGQEVPVARDLGAANAPLAGRPLEPGLPARGEDGAAPPPPDGAPHRNRVAEWRA